MVTTGSSPLTSLSLQNRWGKQILPEWTHGIEITDPANATALVTKAVSTSKQGFIYGFYISTPVAIDCKINWTSNSVSKSLRIINSGKGTTIFTDMVPINEGTPADANTNMTITNVGSGLGVFQCGLFTGEV